MAETIQTALIMGLFPGLMVYAAMTDLIDRRIANWVSLALLAGFVAFALASGMGFGQFGAHLGVAFLAFVVGFGAFALGTMGGGDVKLIAASMIWFGPQGAATYAIAFSLAGLAITLVFVALRLDSMQYLLSSNPLTRPFAGRDPTGRDIPYGLAISSGALFLLPALMGIHGVL